jgi:hypothetical protein
MPSADLARRVEMLEETLRSLRGLPDGVKELKRRLTGVEVQVLQLRTDMRDEFSAMGGEMATKTGLADGLAAVRREMATKTDLAEGLAAVRREMATKTDLADGLLAVRREMATKKDLADGLAAFREDLKNHELADQKRELREDIAGMGQDLARIILETQRQIGEGQSQTRMMFEEILSRLKVPGEGNAGPAV